MKTICFVVPSFPSVSETFVTNQLLQAKLHGYQVVLLTNKLLPLKQSSQQELLIKYGVIEHTNVVDYNIPENKLKRSIITFFLILKYFKYWSREKNLLLRKRFSILPFQLAFYSQFKNVTVFHIQFALAGLEIARMKSIGILPGKIITTFHGYDAHFENENQLTLLQNRYSLLLKYSQYLTINTNYLRKKVQLLGGELNKIKTIPMGIDLDFFYSRKDKLIQDYSEIRLISVGRLVELKGFDYAIKSVKIIIQKGFNVQYTIVGEGVEKAKLLKLISKLELKDSVFIVGKKNQTEIKALLEDNHVFLMSSVTDGTNRAEAQGVVTAEAQAMGLPVVAFRSGGVPYTILENKTGFLVNEKNVEDYARSIIKIIEDPKCYKKMSIAAKSFIKNHFSRESLAKDFFDLYE